MKVYIVFQDVPFEFGQIWGVFSTQEKAKKYKKQIKQEDEYYKNIEIEEWEEMFIIEEYDVE